MKYKRKTKPAIWMTAFPKQVDRRTEERKRQWRELDALAAVAFLRRFKLCQVCCRTLPVHRHHVVGRSGPQKDDPKNWRAVCFQCHRWIHDHPAEARKRGLLAEKGKWNV